MALLTALLQVTHYDDDLASSNPALRNVDRKRLIRDLSVGAPLVQRATLAPGESRTFWDGSRALGVDGTTQLALSLSPLDPSRYRLALASGTSPAFRVDRAFNANTSTLTFTVQANGTVVVTSSGGAPNYAGVQVGDVVLVPGIETGDSASPFDTTPTPGVKNTGYWTVLAKTGSSLTLARTGGFVGVTQAVAVTANSQVQAFSAAGVQVGDVLELSAGFSASALRTYGILAATPTYVEFQSTVPLAAETATPTASGIKAYTDAKRFVYVEADQAVVVQLNGDTSVVFGLISPVVTEGSPVVQPAVYFRTANAWKAVVYNASQVPAKVYMVGIGAA